MKILVLFVMLILFVGCCSKRIVQYRHDIFAIDLPLKNPEDTNYFWILPDNQNITSFTLKRRRRRDSNRWVQQMVVQANKTGRFKVSFYYIHLLHPSFEVLDSTTKKITIKR